MKNIGLILEGGGMRGIYTTGVLDAFIDADLYFPYTIGVSAGACNASSYISKQKGRNKKIYLDYSRDPRYIGYKNLITKKSLFGMDFIFDELPNNLVPFDFDTFNSSESRFMIVATDCKTGKPVYFEKGKDKDILTAMRASSSLPFLSPMVEYEDMLLLDGGISDSIPIHKSIEDGFDKNVIVLTRNRGYKKPPFKHTFLLKKFYRKYPNLIDAVLNRYKIYNESLDYIFKLEKENKAFIICPEKKIDIDRTEKDPVKLKKLYDEGYDETKKCLSRLNDWINK